MEPNLEFWRSHGESFLNRLRIWLNILVPSSVLASEAEILNARSLIRTQQQIDGNPSSAWILSLTSVHPDTGTVISPAFRPQAFLPVSVPMVVASLIPHKGVAPAVFWNFLLQSYCAGFNHVNRNRTATPDNKTSFKQSVLITGAIAYSTVAAALPQIILKRLQLSSVVAQAFCRTLLPVPLTTCLAAFSVFVVRSEESENGINVFDSKGNFVGVSKEAGAKAVRETAISRAALIGTTAAVPSLLLLLLQRAKFTRLNSLILAPVRHVSTAIVFGLMIPVSFSMFSQVGKIQKRDLEKELQMLSDEQELFYHRGL